MGDYHQVISTTLYSPPSSPSETKDRPRKRKYSNYAPVTPEIDGPTGQLKRKQASPPSQRQSGSKRPAPGPSDDNSPHQPPSQRPRIDLSSSLNSVSNPDQVEDRNKLESADGGSSSLPLDVWIVNMDHMLKMLRRVRATNADGCSREFNFMSDPVLACLVSAQTMMMACTADLIFRRAADPQCKGPPNRANEAVGDETQAKPSTHY